MEPGLGESYNWMVRAFGSRCKSENVGSDAFECAVSIGAGGAESMESWATSNQVTTWLDPTALGREPEQSNRVAVAVLLDVSLAAWSLAPALSSYFLSVL